METLSERNPENVDWNADTEVQLFHAMKGHKPVGVNRYFQMACIHQKFSASINKEISSQTIWEHLDTMYDMAALHESEILPFPNPENEFVLPDNDFGDLLSKRRGKNAAAQLNDSEPTKRASSPAPKASPATKLSRTAEEEKPIPTSRRPEATGGKTGKGDWNAAKFSPVPSAGGKVRRNEMEAASRTGGKTKSDTLRKSESASSSPAPSPGGKVKPDHAHGKIKAETTSRKSDAGAATPATTSKKSEGSKGKAEAPRKATDSRTDATKRTDTPKGAKGEGRGESRGDGKADSKSGGGSKADGAAAKRNEGSSKAKESGRKSEGRGPRNEESAASTAKGGTASRSAKEEAESSPKRKRASRLDQPKAASPLVGGHSKRRR
ncbi:unnamed protein product [Ixodes hexagonus]